MPLHQEQARIIAVQGFRAIAFITKSLRLIAGRAEAAPGRHLCSAAGAHQGESPGVPRPHLGDTYAAPREHPRANR
ncbi:MAG: hypothetical protein J4N97_11845, partial [Chloroflexi bacterium]|nr:hypothetical protein [Chloroflexota bacterium]